MNIFDKINKLNLQKDAADERAPLADIDIAFAKLNPNLPSVHA